jgi:hypothetical protein
MVENLLHQYMVTKNVKNCLKTQNTPETKNIPSSDLILGVYKVEKTLNINSSHHIEPFNIKKQLF